MGHNIVFPVRASLGKRKLQSLSGLRPSNMSVTFVQTLQGDSGANIWVEDEEGRKFGMVIGDVELKLLQAGLEKHRQEMTKL